MFFYFQGNTHMTTSGIR